MEVLKHPIVTEKISKQYDKGIYGFVVDNRANKIQIKREVEKMYNVIVDSVNTMRYMGKEKVRHTKRYIMKGRKASFKKAIVYLKGDGVLDLYGEI